MSRLAELIRRRILAEGPIPFSRFMEEALYHPGLGYYASGRRRTGASGDFYTSPQAHPVFGALLALQLERMWDLIGRPKLFHVVEPGAGDGQLAGDILAFSQHLQAGFHDALIYVAIDLQPGTLRHVRGARPVAGRGLPLRGLLGCIVSNELLDAFPVHRLVVEAGALREVYVTAGGQSFAEVLGDVSSTVQAMLEVTDKLPPDGTRLEICPGVWSWMGEVSRALEAGFVLTIDYGYGEASGEGTLASYRRHALTDPYEMVGEQDLTAHVDFGAAIEAGRRAGLRPLDLMSQRRFLRSLGIGAFQDAAARLRLPQAQHEANQMGMLDLIRPDDGLGGFGVMIQCKGLPGVGTGDLALKRHVREDVTAGELPVPLLSKEHMPLLEGRYRAT